MEDIDAKLDSMSLEELQELDKQLEIGGDVKLSTETGNVGEPVAKEPGAVDKLLAIQDGFTSPIINFGEDVVSAGRRFITDPLGITESEETAKREQLLNQERQQRNAEYSRSGLGAYRTAGKVAGNLAMLAAPGGAVAKLSKAAKSAVVGEAALGGTMGLIKTDGDVKARIQGAAKDAAMFAALGAGGRAIANRFRRGIGAKVNKDTVQAFKDAGVKPFASQITDDIAKSGVLRTTERLLKSIPIIGTKKATVSQFRDLSNTAVKVRDALSKEVDRIPKIKEGFESLEKAIGSVPVNVSSMVKKIGKELDQLSKPGLERSVTGEYRKVLQGMQSSLSAQGGVTFKDLRDLKTVLSPEIAKMSKGVDAGTTSKFIYKKAVKLQDDLETLLQEAASGAGAGPQYMLLKTGFQRATEAKTLRNIFEDSVSKNNNQINVSTLISKFKQAEKKGLIKEVQGPEMNKLIKGLKVVASKLDYAKEPTSNLSIAGGTGIGGGIASLLYFSGLPAAAVFSTAVKGISMALTTPLGQKLLMHAGEPGKATSVIAVLTRLGATGIADATRLDQTNLSNLSDEELENMSLKELEALDRQLARGIADGKQ